MIGGGLGTRIRAVVGIALAQLRHDRTRTVLAVLGITLAVLATTLLGGVGIGVVETGEEKFDASGRDLWVTGGPVRLSPGTVGGFENTVLDAHELSASIESREEVQTAVPMAFQTVYVSNDSGDWETLVGVGAPARGGTVQITEGQEFQNRDVHYADGNYSGPMTNEVIIDQRTADMFNVSVGDTLSIGGTIADARQNQFTVVGISPTFSRFLGTPTVTLHLSELQEVTGTTTADRASLITVDVVDSADPAAVAAEIEEEHPDYDVRTNREQLRATLERQAVILASGGSLVVLAVLAGIALTANLMLSVVYQQRRELAALRALGSRTSTLIGVVVVQALCLGVVGGALGVAATMPLANGLDAVAVALVGFENVVRTPRWVLAGGFAVSLPISLLGAAVAGWQVATHTPVEGRR
jgi:putative ABC transport system permease protein